MSAPDELPLTETRDDPLGITQLGRDGVARWLNADRTSVLKYKRLSPEQIANLAVGMDQKTKDALVGVDGRDVTDQEQLWALPMIYKVPKSESMSENKKAAEKQGEATSDK